MNFFRRPQVPEIDPHEAKERRDAGAFLVDVREQDEYATSRIPGGKLFPLGELADRLDELPEDRELVVYCRSGARSARAVEFLQAQGREAVNLAGGILAWAEAGLHVKE